MCYSRVITRTQWNFTSTTGISARTSGRSVWSTTRSSVVRQQIHADQVCSLLQFLALGKLWHWYLMAWQNQCVTFNFQTKDPNLNKVCIPLLLTGDREKHKLLSRGSSFRHVFIITTMYELLLTLPSSSFDFLKVLLDLLYIGLYFPHVLEFVYSSSSAYI